MQGGDSDDEIAELRIQALLTKRENEAEVLKSSHTDHRAQASVYRRPTSQYGPPYGGRYQGNNRRGNYSQPFRPYKMNPYHPNFAGKTVNTSNIVVLTSSENDGSRSSIPIFDPKRPPPSLPVQLVPSGLPQSKPSAKLILPQDRYSGNNLQPEEEPKKEMNAKMRRLQGSSSNDDSSDSSDDTSSDSSSDTSSSEDSSSNKSASSKSSSYLKSPDNYKDESKERNVSKITEPLLSPRRKSPDISLKNRPRIIGESERKSFSRSPSPLLAKTILKKSRSRSPKRKNSKDVLENDRRLSPRQKDRSDRTTKPILSPIRSRRITPPIHHRSTSPLRARIRSPYSKGDGRLPSPLNRRIELSPRYGSPSPRRNPRFRSKSPIPMRLRSKSKSPWRHRSRSPSFHRLRLHDRSPRRGALSRTPPYRISPPYSQFREESPLRNRKRLVHSPSPRRSFDQRSPRRRIASPDFMSGSHRLSPRRIDPISRNSPPRKRFRSRSPLTHAHPVNKLHHDIAHSNGRMRPSYDESPRRSQSKLSPSPKPLMRKRIENPLPVKDPPLETSRYRRDQKAIKEQERGRYQASPARERIVLSRSRPATDFQSKESGSGNHSRRHHRDLDRREAKSPEHKPREDQTSSKHREDSHFKRGHKEQGRRNLGHLTNSSQSRQTTLSSAKIDNRILLNRRQEAPVEKKKRRIGESKAYSRNNVTRYEEKIPATKTADAINPLRVSSHKKGDEDAKVIHKRLKRKSPVSKTTLKDPSPTVPIKGPRTPPYSPGEISERVDDVIAASHITSSPVSEKHLLEPSVSPLKSISSQPYVPETSSPLKKLDINSSKESIEEGLCSQQESEEPTDSSLPSFHIKSPEGSLKEKSHKKKKKKSKDSTKKSPKKSKKKKKHKDGKEKKHKKRSKETKKHKDEREFSNPPSKRTKESRGFSITVQPGSRRVITTDKPPIKERISETVPAKLPVHMRLGPPKHTPNSGRQERNWGRNAGKRRRRD